MTTHSADAIGTLIDSVKPIVSMERDGLVVIALGSTADADGPAYLTLAEAAESKGVDVHELGGGTVPAVEVETGDDPVVIFGGDTIVGGKQNRIVNVTIWLTPQQKTHIPVTCLEPVAGTRVRRRASRPAPRRTWACADAEQRRSTPAPVMAAALGDEPAPHRYSADQGAVWAEVDMKHERAATSSRTGALHDLYAREASDVEALERAFPYPDGATGAAIGIGGRLVALEVFDRPATARKLWRRVIEGAVRAHLDHQRMVAAGGDGLPCRSGQEMMVAIRP